MGMPFTENVDKTFVDTPGFSACSVRLTFLYYVRDTRFRHRNASLPPALGTTAVSMSPFLEVVIAHVVIVEQIVIGQAPPGIIHVLHFLFVIGAIF